MDDVSVQTRVLRSRGRVRTVSARVVDGVLEIRAPDGMSDTELAPIIERLRKRIENRRVKRTLDTSDLQRRADALNATYFDGKLRWRIIEWVTNQDRRWGSCTPSTGSIRVSHRLRELPPWVLDAVIVHELAHLLEANHSPRFWELANRFPLTERARGYLMAVAGEEQEGDM